MGMDTPTQCLLVETRNRQVPRDFSPLGTNGSLREGGAHPQTHTPPSSPNPGQQSGRADRGWSPCHSVLKMGTLATSEGLGFLVCRSVALLTGTVSTEKNQPPMSEAG